MDEGSTRTRGGAAGGAAKAAGAASAAAIIPGGFTPWFYRGFGKYVGRLFAKRFHAVRVARADATASGGASVGIEGLRALDAQAAPVAVVLNHCAWWDPLVCVLLGSRLMPSRSGFGPMDAAMLRKFGIFKKLGLFGVDPDDPRALKPMVAYCVERFERDAKATMWVTPQGAFADVRDPIVLRPGTAAVLARAPGTVRVMSVAVEYGFWLEQKPEVFVRVVGVDAPGAGGAARAGGVGGAGGAGGASTGAWQRSLTDAMAANQAALATLVRARKPAAFDVLLGAGAARTNPVYDAWLKLRGKGSAIEVRQGPTVRQSPTRPAKP